MDPMTLLGRVGFPSDGWVVEDLAHTRWLTPGIWQLQRGEERRVLKWLSAARSLGETAWEAHWSSRSAEQTRWNFWAREALAYKSNLPTRHFGGPDGFDAPNCITCEVTEHDAVLLLEFVDGVAAEHWTINEYGDAARNLGAVHSRAIFPVEPWLSRHFIRDYSTGSSAIWTSGPRISFAGRTVESRSFDWAFVGQGAIGEDIGNLIPDAAFDHFVSANQLPELEASVLTGYITGLRAGGWDGDHTEVRRNVWASAVKYDWLTPQLLERASASTHLRYGGVEEIDAKHLFRERGLALEFSLSRALKALEHL